MHTVAKISFRNICYFTEVVCEGVFFFFNKHLSFFRQFDPHELFWFCCFITIALALRFLNDKPPKVMFLVHLLVVHLLRAILPVGEIYALFTKCLSSVN